MKNYIHKVQYYETDKMGITHHSNYIRWMEEARIDFLEQKGFGYDRVEELGIISPVVSVECKYKAVTKFAEEVEIVVFVESFNGIRLTLGYDMKNREGKTVCIAKSEHCFMDDKGKIINIAKVCPEFFEAINES
ncbi:MAG: acyl-CoA thioesterase [Lachnospiraceae bacterium]|nr:acyl-CoA thioesterase [Lachnospiraceae bacterium]